ncbi:condensation domain-containing protein [Streptomyces sp. NPDC088400]|uniref:condensation domain-containing protein n=1 Tax=Streptomyces sp. NPDC088400 TaxID=3365861 RepID=UPI00382BE2AF
MTVDVTVTDLSAHDEDAGLAERWCQGHASQAFAMDRAPLFRFGLARLSPDRWVLVTVFHHAIVDGWSMGVVWRELQELYNTRRRGTADRIPLPTVQFMDCARVEHELDGERRAELERFWRTELDGVPLRLDLPYDRPRPTTLSGRGALHTWVIDGDTPRRLPDTATCLGATPYTVLAAAFATWAAGLCAEPADVVLAASSANRMRRERSDVIGLLGDAVLLRARLGEAETFADLVTQLSATLFTALDLPGTAAHRRGRAPLARDRERAVPHRAVHRGHHTAAHPRPGVGDGRGARPAHAGGGAQRAVRGASARGAGHHRHPRVLHGPVRRTTVEAWGRIFTSLLEEVIKDPGRLLRSLFRPAPEEPKE